MTYGQAIAKLPADAKWSCSFGNPGQAGFNEYYRDAAGNRYELSNGSWWDDGEKWSVRRA